MWEVLWLVSLVLASTPPLWWVTRLMCTPSPTSQVLRHSSGAQMGMCVLLLVYLNCMQCTLLTRLNAWPLEILLLRFVRDKFKFGANDMRILPDCITLGRLHHLVEVYIHHVIALVLCMKDIHFVISTALWFVDCISHIAETCIMRNCESYPITMLKILLMSSAMWCHQLCLQITDPKASNFVCMSSCGWNRR